MAHINSRVQATENQLTELEAAVSSHLDSIITIKIMVLKYLHQLGVKEYCENDKKENSSCGQHPRHLTFPFPISHGNETSDMYCHRSIFPLTYPKILSK